MRISLSDEAKSDGQDVVDWYIEEGVFPAVNAFVDKLKLTLHPFRQFPEMAAPSTHGTRVLPLRTFPYSLVHRMHGSLVRIIAITYHSLRPVYWAGRR